VNLRDQQPPETHYWNTSSERVRFQMDTVRMQTQRISKRYVDGELWSPHIGDGLFLIVGLLRLQRACELARTRGLAGAPDAAEPGDPTVDVSADRSVHSTGTRCNAFRRVTEGSNSATILRTTPEPIGMVRCDNRR
jgi:hypothetical protein